MNKTVRYCIQCGREIGDAELCPNPDCGGIPNFYRNIPGPDPGRKRAAQRREAHARPTRGATAALGHRPLPSAQAGDAEPRMTMPITVEPVAVLRGVSPPHDEHPVLPGTFLVGARRPSEIIIDRREVSSRHARLECRTGSDGRWEITLADLKSTNGTFVNGERIVSRRLLPGDRVRFANVEYELRFLAAESPRMTMPLRPGPA